VASTPIINHPQAAILQAEAIVKRPVVVDDGNGGDAIAIRSMMNLEVSFDHRVMDGGVALRFLNAVKRRLEAYGLESGLK
jgi:pyruvate/2-oxoglutarate dehydrogenase complex dihydrolipoamide acyltransferase (E2) component